MIIHNNYDIPYGILSLKHQNSDEKTVIQNIINSLNIPKKNCNKEDLNDYVDEKIKDIIICSIKSLIYNYSITIPGFDIELLNTGTTNLIYTEKLNVNSNIDNIIKKVYPILLFKYRNKLYIKYRIKINELLLAIRTVKEHNDDVLQYLRMLRSGVGIDNITKIILDKYNTYSNVENIPDNLPALPEKIILLFINSQDLITVNSINNLTINLSSTFSLLNYQININDTSFDNAQQYLLYSIYNKLSNNTKILNNNIMNTEITNIKNNYLYRIIYSYITQNISKYPYKIDYLKSLDNEQIIIQDIKPFQLISKIYNEINSLIPFEKILGKKEPILTYVNNDNFFNKYISDKVNDIIEFNKLFFKVINFQNIKLVIDNFINMEHIEIMNFDRNELLISKISTIHKISDSDAFFIQNYIFSNILYYDNLVKLKNSDSDIFWVKKEIIKNQYNIFNNNYNSINSMKYILNILRNIYNKPLKKIDVQKVYNLLNNNSSIIYFNNNEDLDENQLTEYLNKKSIDLDQSLNKNKFRINLYAKY